MSNTDMEKRAETDPMLPATSLSAEAAREPLRPPESSTIETTTDEESSTSHEAAVASAHAVEDTEGKHTALQSVKDWGKRWRQGAIERTPAFIVNHSSNFIGAMQFCAELFMFKSSGLDLVDKANQGKPLHYLIDPPKNIFGGVFKKVMGQNNTAAKVAEKAPFTFESIFGVFGRLNDTKTATLRDRVNAAGEFQKMTNKWSARSSFCGLMGMTIAALLPDKKDTPEETEKYAIMAKQQPVKYAMTRIYQALNPIEWWNHKRQFAGLGMLFAGLLSFTSGFRQVAGKELGKQLYMHNGWQMAGGAITTAGGAQLLMAVDNETGWRNFGLTQIARMSTLPASIYTRYKGVKISEEQASWVGLNVKDITQNIQEQGAGHYFAAQGVLQAKNVFAASVGGAEKDKDGNAVDHQRMREEASLKEKKIRAQKKLKKAEQAQHELEKAKEAVHEKIAEEVKTTVPEAKPVEHKTAAHEDIQQDVSRDLPSVPSTTVVAPHAVELAMPERAQKMHEAAAV